MTRKRAILYTRVSTDEQANRGYSLSYQIERLQKYCEMHDIAVVNHFKDDYSAKTFDRPEFRKLLEVCKRNRGTINLILVVNWSRFSRNAGDSYGMISLFNRMGIEIQAIEQPLDLSIPENKMMLAFYLAAPEVENDRRSMNVTMGMHRAKKDGRHWGHPPVGYRHIKGLDGKGKLIIDERKGRLIAEMFSEFAKGIYHTEHLRRMMSEKGLRISRSALPCLLKNQLYIGKIFVPAFKGEPAYFVKGLHPPLITEKIFMDVQNVLNNKSMKKRSPNTVREEFPLRGFLQCSRCGATLTASASKGRSERYYYYHCQNGCKERFSAAVANEEFKRFLTTIKLNPQVAELYKVILYDHFKEGRKNETREVKVIDDQISKCKTRIKNAQQLMLDGELTSSEYKEIKSNQEIEIDELIIKKSRIGEGGDNYKEYLSQAALILVNLDKAYGMANLEIKNHILGSIFSGKLIYKNEKYRTTLLNEVLSLITSEFDDLNQKKQANQIFQSNLPCSVVLTGIEPVLPE